MDLTLKENVTLKNCHVFLKITIELIDFSNCSDENCESSLAILLLQCIHKKSLFYEKKLNFCIYQDHI